MVDRPRGRQSWRWAPLGPRADVRGELGQLVWARPRGRPVIQGQITAVYQLEPLTTILVELDEDEVFPARICELPPTKEVSPHASQSQPALGPRSPDVGNDALADVAF